MGLKNLGLRSLWGKPLSRDRLEEKLSKLIDSGIDELSRKAKKTIETCVRLSENFDSDEPIATRTIREIGISVYITTKVYRFNGVSLSYLEARESPGGGIPPFGYDDTNQIELTYNDPTTKKNVKFSACRYRTLTPSLPSVWSEWTHKVSFAE